MRSIRASVAALIPIALCLFCSAQGPKSDRAQRGPAADKPLLVLKLEIDSAPNSTEQDKTKSCLEKYPQLACVPLIATITNESKKPILRWFNTCGGDLKSLAISIQRPDGEWQLLQHFLFPCTRSFVVVYTILPGETVKRAFRLADFVDLEVHDDGWIHASDGYRTILASGPKVIRATWRIFGCVANKPYDGMFPPSPKYGVLPCIEEAQPYAQPYKEFVSTYSNELVLK